MPKKGHSLWNASESLLLVERLEIADTFFARLRGLLGRSGLERDEALLITGCRQVHMLFMKFPIDVIFLGEGDLAMHFEHSLRPWRISPNVAGAVSVIELQAGSLARLTIKRGDRLEVRSNTSPT